MVGQVLDTVLRVIGGVVRFQRHAVVAHSVGAMLAEPRVATWNLSISSTPVFIDCILFDDFPGSGTCGIGFRGVGGRGC